MHIKLDIFNTFSGVIYTAEIECEETDTQSVKLGLAVEWAVKKGAYLEGANLRGANLNGANLNGANLNGANLYGADLEDANLEDADLRGADLRGAYLNGANLYGANLRGANLNGANLNGANLYGADLEGAYLKGAYLRGAYLESADLEGAYLNGANLYGANFGDIPVIPEIHKAVFEAASAKNALDMGEWHGNGGFCGTTHCRAGWVTHLAGDEGKALELKIGTPAAALAIYAANDPEYISRDGIPNFYTDNETALSDMKRLAEMETA